MWGNVPSFATCEPGSGQQVVGYAAGMQQIVNWTYPFSVH